MNSAAGEARLPLSKENVLAHLEVLLADRRFASAERNAKFLRYVVERTLEGRTIEIKETVIASEVYGRSPAYDPKVDSIVRVEATRLRQKLRNYYENEGRRAEIRIHMPTGTYVPRFESTSSFRDHSVDPVQLTAAKGLSWRRLVAAIAVTVAAMLVQFARVTGAVSNPDVAAIAAWEEGVTLLGQDPHAAETQRGAPATLLRAIERIEFAVAKSPRFARGWASLAESYDYAYAYVDRDRFDDARRAEAAARRAIALDKTFAPGHHMLGLILWGMKWDFPNAEAAYKRALELDPKNIYAVVEFSDLLRETGRATQAAELIRASRKLLPALPQLATKESEIELDLGHTDAAVAAAKAALQFKRNFLRAHVALGTAEERRGNTATALAEYEHVLTVDPFERRALPAYGYLLARIGQRERAREIVRKLERIDSTIRDCAYQVAVVYAGLGEDEQALWWLERALQTHQVHLPFASVEYRFLEIRKHARFRAIVTRLGLPPGFTS